MGMRMQFKKIICATDFSDLSNHAVSYGIELAREFKAKLYLCHVIDLSSATMYGEATFAFEAQYVHMEEYAHERLRRLIGENQIDWEPLVSTGRAADEITLLAEEKSVDLAIAATRGRSGLKRLILGSVTEHLMRTLPCPLMIVPRLELNLQTEPAQAVRFKNILVGCDFSPNSTLAFQYAISLAQEFQSELHLVHVIEPPVYKDLPKSVEEARDKLRQGLHKQLKERLENMVPKEASNWCKPKIMLLAGHAHEELSKYAVVQDIDLIVLGVTGHRLVEALFVGSTTDRVVRRAPCTVLSVRPMP
jgi:nucleotide-binding universal stress UspA family protein